MTKLLKRFANDESGATAIEYALIAGLLAIVIVPGVTLVGGKVETVFQNVATALK